MPLTSKEKAELIEHIKSRIDSGEIWCLIYDVEEIIQSMPEQAENTQALIKLRDKVKDWLDNPNEIGMWYERNSGYFYDIGTFGNDWHLGILEPTGYEEKGLFVGKWYKANPPESEVGNA